MVAGPQASSALAASVTVQYACAPGAARTDRDKATAIWRATGFGAQDESQQNARYDWIYLLNPQGEGEVNFLNVLGQSGPVGFLGVGARAWTVGGQPVKAGVLVDFVVHPRHRTVAPALLLQRKGRERALESMELLIGLPDVKAVPIFKRLGSAVAFDFQRHVRVLHYGGYLGRYIPRWLARIVARPAALLDGCAMRLRVLGSTLAGEWLDRFDGRFDDLWRRFDKEGRSLGVRDRQFLEWRFADQPGHRNQTFAISRRDTGELQMYFVCQRAGSALAVKDVLGVGSEAQLVRGWLLLCLAARRMGAFAVSVQIHGDDRMSCALRGAGFVVRDGRPFFAVMPSADCTATEESAWYVTQADEDI